MNACQCDVDEKVVCVVTSFRELTVLAAAKFYFQQQVTAGAACSAASQTLDRKSVV